MGDTTIFRARRIHTLADDGSTHHDAVAVTNGIISGVGSLDALRAEHDGTVDDTLADSVVLPGFVEAHSHHFTGGFWQFPYCGWFDRTDPDGRIWTGCRTFEAVLDRLREAEAELDDPTTPLVAWGLDPIYFPGDRLVADDLDRVSSTRPVVVVHASIHLVTVNHALMASEGIDHTTQVEGVPLDGEGNPIGELQEIAAMSLAGNAFAHFFGSLMTDTAFELYGELARRAGITTLADLGTVVVADEAMVDMVARVVAADSFPARVSVFHNPGFGGPQDPTEAAAFVLERQARSTPKLKFGMVKLILDGSIQGFTARLNPPGYLDDRPNGLWLLPPERVMELVAGFHAAGITIHAHCNGDQAVDVFLEAVERAQAAHPLHDHRHTVQHSQLTTRAQYERIARLGCCANLFSNHLWFWGDQHATITVGEERASTMNAAATSMRLGIPTSMHCDAPVTPLGPLRVARSAVTRITPTGRLLGADERISTLEALMALTRAAAHQLKMDTEVGSIEVGKQADFAVLADDPLETDPEALDEIEVRGTVLAGVAQLNDQAGRSA